MNFLFINVKDFDVCCTEEEDSCTVCDNMRSAEDWKTAGETA
jgi:hypothetical protein